MHHNLESVDQVSNQNIYFVLCFFVCVVRGCLCFAVLLNRKQYQILFCFATIFSYSHLYVMKDQFNQDL